MAQGGRRNLSQTVRLLIEAALREPRTLIGDGKLSVLAGKTTPEEVLRVSSREEL